MYSSNQRKFVFGLWVAVGVVCLGLAIYIVSIYMEKSTNRTEDAEDIADNAEYQMPSMEEVLNYRGFIDEVPEGLHGKIYITLELGQELRPRTFALDLNTQTVIEGKYSAWNQYVSMYATPISTSSEQVLFYASPYELNPERPHPFIAPVSTYASDKEGNVSLVANASYQLKRPLDWSHERERYTFSAWPNSGTFAEATRARTAEGWEIYVGDLEGNEQKVAENGINPRWGSDGNIYYLGVDGVYRYNFDEQTTERLWQVDEGVMYGRQMDMSPDGNMIALTNTLVGGIQVMRISDLQNFALEQQFVYTDDTRRFFDISFSPDSKYLVYISTRKRGFDEPVEYSYLEVMKVSDQTTYRLIDAYNEYLAVAPRWSF